MNTRDCTRGIAAFVSIAALFTALLTAPFFHLHEQGEHGEHASEVHAHLLELEDDHHHETDIEDSHPHQIARSVDFFTFVDAPAGMDLSVELTEAVAVFLPEEHWSFVDVTIPQAHSPPGLDRSVPRSPPTF